jgi:hypothetical protein
MFWSGIGDWDLPDTDFIHADIERRRRQVQRVRGEISQLQRSLTSSAFAEAPLRG